MKKIYFLLLALCFFSTANAQIVNIPDPIFKARLLQTSTNLTVVAKNLAGVAFKIDANNNKEIEASEALQVYELQVLGTSTSNQILSVEGIKSFLNLKKFTCNQNRITEIDLSGLINLTLLDCSANGTITSLNVKGLVNMQNLKCDNSPIKSLDLTGMSNLQYLNCQENQLSSLNLSGLTSLSSLYCGINNLTTLDVSDSPNLVFFGFNLNPLVSLFMKNSKSETLLDFGNITTLQYICADDVDLKNVQAILTKYGYINCTLNSYCTFNPGGIFYTIQGKSRFDFDSTGCDNTDSAFPNLKFSINNGTTIGRIVSNNSGNYYIPVQSGNYTITPTLENPTYFNIAPSKVILNFPSQSSPNFQDFCITTNGNHNDLEISTIPINKARPGFDAKYKIVFKNKGTVVQSGSINFNFNDSILDFLNSTPLIDSQSPSTLNWNFVNLKPLETREIIVTLNVNSPVEVPPVNSGSVLNYVTKINSLAIDENNTDNTFNLNQIVVNSFDPNDKTCLEGMTVSSNDIGKYVHYLIRFENTGTFPAENIVVKDMIDLSKFDISTLIPFNASHSFVTNITAGNKVEFIFENINLPFDDANNDGYIAFKIKTLPTLKVGDTFTNDASIFFDYNFPIVTNKATSTFKTLGIQDFEFSSYFTLYPNPAKSVLNISSKEIIEVKSISIYNTLGQLLLVIPNAEKVSKIDVSSLTAGNYFIKINSDIGTSNARFIKE